MKNFKTRLATHAAVAYGTAAGLMATAAAQTTDTRGAFFGGDDAPGISGIRTETGRDGGLVNTITGLVNSLLTLLGIVAVLIIIYAGVRLIISRGDDKAVQDARKTLLYAVFGFVLIVLSYQIVNFIVGILGGETAAAI